MFAPKVVDGPNVGGVLLARVPVKGPDPNWGALVLSGGLEVVTGALVVVGFVAWVVFDGPNANCVVFS